MLAKNVSVGGASDLNVIITTSALVPLFMNTKSTAIFFSPQDSFIHNGPESQGNRKYCGIAL